MDVTAGEPRSSGGMTKRSLDLYQQQLADRDRALQRREERLTAREAAVASQVRCHSADQVELDRLRKLQSKHQIAMQGAEAKGHRLERELATARNQVRELRLKLNSAVRANERIAPDAAKLASKAKFTAEQRQLTATIAGLIALHGTHYTRRALTKATSLAHLCHPDLGKAESRVVGLPDPRYTYTDRGIKRY